jgi:hypothetical protein
MVWGPVDLEDFMAHLVSCHIFQTTAFKFRFSLIAELLGKHNLNHLWCV